MTTKSKDAAGAAGFSVVEIRETTAKAYPLPYRVHNHRNTNQFGDDPEKWVGYPWIGAGGESGGRLDIEIADLDARGDGSDASIEQAKHAAAFIVIACNSILPLADSYERLRERLTTLLTALDEEAALTNKYDRMLSVSDAYSHDELDRAAEDASRALATVCDEIAAARKALEQDSNQ